MGIRSAFAKLQETQNFTADPEQERIVDRLAELQRRAQDAPGSMQRILQKLGATRGEPVRGLYLWGGVGRGKTFLMDLFYRTLDVEAKRRIHFHRIMREAHERMQALGNVENPLDRVADELAAQARVLCFDEFFVNDIGDAMVLAGLLRGLFERQVMLIATSNTPPADLYAGGLQRERFLPAIELLEAHTDVVEMDSGIDYRLRLLEQAGTYLTPPDDAADERLREIFDNVARGSASNSRQITVLGRDIDTVRAAKGVVWFRFDAICDGPRSQNDYIEIARWYQTVIVSSIPILDARADNQTRRFISLVDEFYDRRVKLVVSAMTPANELYQGEKLAFEFQRTASRLIEMQSSDYLHAAHIA